MSPAIQTADPKPLLHNPGGNHRDEVPAVSSRRKRPAPSPRTFWGLVFPFLVVVSAVLVFTVWRDGTKLVFDSNAGERIETITDPTAPGYRAFVDPTPTMLIAHLGDDSELVGLTVLAQTALDQGGSAVVISADLLLEPTDDPDDAVLMRDLYATEGMAGLSRGVGDLFGFGFRETLEITADNLSGWLRLVEPLPVVLHDDLVTVNSEGLVDIRYPAGVHQLNGVDAAAVYGWRNDGEFDSNRTQRQVEIWEVWLSEVGRADDLMAATLPFEDGLSGYLRSLGTGTRRLEALPLEARLSVGDALPIYVQTDQQRQQLERLAREMVPLPIASHPGTRPTVSLLDGTGMGVPRDKMLSILVDAGAEVTLIGNAQAFGTAETTVAYHIADRRQAAIALAGTIGASATFAEDLKQPVDLTVTVGLDRVDS